MRGIQHGNVLAQTLVHGLETQKLLIDVSATFDNRALSFEAVFAVKRVVAEIAREKSAAKRN
jgi:hypothetical protein